MRDRATAAVVTALVLFLASSAPAETARPPGETRPVLDFEDASIWTSENDSPFECRSERVSEGAKSLRVHYTNKPQWSNVLTQRISGDWTGWRYLNFDLYLEGDLPSGFGIWVRDRHQHKAVESFQIGPGWNTLSVDLDRMKKTAEFDRSRPMSLCLYKATEREITAHLDNMYLSKALPVAPEARPVRTPDNELVANGGFEEMGEADDLGSPFTSWTARRWSGASFLSRGVKAVHSGAASAMLDGRGPCKIGWISPVIKIKSPTKLKLTAHLMAEGLAKGTYGKHASIMLTDYAEKPIPGAAMDLPGGTYAWKRAELVCDLPPKCPVVKVFIQLYGKGRLWVDDVSLRGVDLAAKTGAAFADAGRVTPPDAPVVTETPRTLKLRARAERSVSELRDVVAEAKEKGVETLYDEIPLMLAELAFEVRWDLPEHLGLREGYALYVLERAEAAKKHLRLVMAGRAPDMKVPPHPDLAKLELKGAYYHEGDRPRILFSMQYHSKGPLVKWFCPEGYAAGIPAVGASRFNFKRTPIWEAYQKFPETHRVYDNGWCGHIIRDQWSAGGSDHCVINLDSPRMREAIAESIAQYAERVKRRKVPPAYINLGFEYSYVNYDSYSARAFRRWLGEKYGTIGKLNAVWKTSHARFDDVKLPPHAPGVHAKNPAKYHDWGEFNLWRFTDYMKWARAEVAKHLPGIPTTTGGGSPFGAGYWKQAIDEEELSDEGVCDIWLSETGSRALGVTSVMDLQRSLSPGKLILDPEYHALPNTCFLMFLHGCGVMDYWWWPGGMNDFYSSSMKHSHLRPLNGVETVMRTALDVRRLPEVIARFPSEPAKLALLYPKATLIQRFPAAQGHKTPFTLETEKTYAAAARLDAPVGFASSKRVLAGELKQYRVLVVPGCRYVSAPVFEKVVEFAKGGGTVVITPTSLVADQYSRRRDYLKRLGIEIVAEELPEMMAGEAKRGIDQGEGELDFIQGPVAKTKVTKEPKRTILLFSRRRGDDPPPKMAAAGIIQTVRASPEWRATGYYEGEVTSPAVLWRRAGKGTIWYLAAQLTLDDMKVFLDRLMDEVHINRPVRVTAGRGMYPDRVESRTVVEDAKERTYLTYVHNLGDAPAKVRLEVRVPGARLASVEDLTAGGVPAGPKLLLKAFETRILRVRLRKAFGVR